MAGASPLGATSAPPAADPPYTVRGGAGSIRVVLEQVATAGVQLQDLADEVGHLGDRVRDVLWQLERITFGTYSYPYQLIEQFRSASAVCGKCARNLDDLGRNAVTARDVYEAADGAVNRAVDGASGLEANLAGRQVLGATGPIALLLGLAAVLQEGAVAGWRNVVEERGRSAPEFVGGILGMPPGLASLLLRMAGPERGSAEAGAGKLRDVLERQGVIAPGQLSVRAVPPEEWSTEPGTGDAREGFLAPTLAGVFAGSQDAYEIAPSAIILRRVERPDGISAWLVDLPGTEDWWPVDTAGVWDMEGDLQAFTADQPGDGNRRRALVSELVLAALRDAGALPADPVMLTGHSGGGIHALAMAADPAFRAEVNVAVVNVAGAPGGNFAIPPGVRVLDLQNVDDAVAGMDLREPPDVSNWVTVTSGRRAGSSPLTPWETLRLGHDLTRYIGDAALLDASSDPSIAAHRAAVLAFLGVSAGTGWVRYQQFVYQGSDGKRSPSQQRTRTAQPGTRVTASGSPR
jgi:hypothetical protein